MRHGGRGPKCHTIHKVSLRSNSCVDELRLQVKVSERESLRLDKVSDNVSP